jgi:hypothetical protein
MITKQTVADKIAAYLYHEISLAELVDWAENALMEGEFDDRDMGVLRTVVSRLGFSGRAGVWVGVGWLRAVASTTRMLCPRGHRGGIANEDQKGQLNFQHQL